MSEDWQPPTWPADCPTCQACGMPLTAAGHHLLPQGSRLEGGPGGVFGFWVLGRWGSRRFYSLLAVYRAIQTREALRLLTKEEEAFWGNRMVEDLHREGR